MHRYEVIIYWSDEDKGLKSFLRPIVLLALQASGRSLARATPAMITGLPLIHGMQGTGISGWILLFYLKP
jgi:hypothetical protein